jgi:hypothetical protein
MLEQSLEVPVARYREIQDGAGDARRSKDEISKVRCTPQRSSLEHSRRKFENPWRKKRFGARYFFSMFIICTRM